MVATSYPRFPGDGVGSFMEPIAKGLAARGHEIHLVAPWHPAHDARKSRRRRPLSFLPLRADGVAERLRLCRRALRRDTALKAAAWAVAPRRSRPAWFKAWRVATKKRATIMHGHWVIPGGVMARRGRTPPLVVSLHGSDVFVAEHNGAARVAARRVLRRAAWVTACSDDLRTRAIGLGADPARIETVPVRRGHVAICADARRARTCGAS